MTSAPPPRERRRADRRRTDRRSDAPEFSATLTEESLFDAMGAGADGTPGSQSGADHADTAGQRGEADWGASSMPAHSPYLARQARRIVGAGDSSFERLYAIFLGARAALGLALLGAQIVGLAMGTRPLAGGVISLAYAVQALTLWLLPRFRRISPAGASSTRLSRRHWVATIGFDLLVFSSLHWLAAAGSFNYAPLLVLPALMAGVLTPRVPAMAAAAVASLVLLATSWYWSASISEATTAMAPAALTGIGLFVITLLAGELALRLAREEMTARGSLELARQQAQLNRLVIEEMADGVMVVDRRARVRAANPAARRLLVAQGIGQPAPFQLQDDPAWRELADRVARAFESLTWPDSSRDVQLPFEAGQVRSLRLRARFTRPRTSSGSDAGREVFCVLFLEDLRSVQARNRQEKLAAMGRVSAGIAHEIRNPLAAIAQANALLREETTNPEQDMLTAMVADNVERLKRIVDDVMEVAPGPGANPRPIDLGAEVGRIVSDWARTSHLPLGTGSRLRVQLPHDPLAVLFDAEHLRRVLVNLLDNARRYASDRPGAISLVAEDRGGGQARLSVASDGDPIPPDIEPFLFEPFFSTRSRGTGLGLYICRELCERYGGSIDYWQHPAGSPHSNEFVVVMRVVSGAALPPKQDRLLP